ncbi:hypothetical protein AGR7B_Cc10396 [Agrobacterium deltaense RV3]|nr:hypothetical protein AGR7B_Cc10396 [Agrobacterium deltaense RV3]
MGLLERRVPVNCNKLRLDRDCAGTAKVQELSFHNSAPMKSLFSQG